jgi:hypothetical protein
LGGRWGSSFAYVVRCAQGSVWTKANLSTDLPDDINCRHGCVWVETSYALSDHYQTISSAPRTFAFCSLRRFVESREQRVESREQRVGSIGQRTPFQPIYAAAVWLASHSSKGPRLPELRPNGSSVHANEIARPFSGAASTQPVPIPTRSRRLTSNVGIKTQRV